MRFLLLSHIKSEAQKLNFVAFILSIFINPEANFDFPIDNYNIIINKNHNKPFKSKFLEFIVFKANILLIIQLLQNLYLVFFLPFYNK